MKNNLLRRATHLWVSAIDLLIDSLLATAWFVITVTLIATGLGTLPVIGVGVVLLALISLISRAASHVERQRAMALYEIPIGEPVRRRTAQTGPIRYLAQIFVDLGDPVTWRLLLHHLVSMVLGVVMIGIWSAGLNVTVLTATHAPAAVASLVAAGCAIVLLAYVYVAGHADKRLSVALLGPGTREVLEQQVDTLADARRGAMDAASIERERIERNLHDGIQPQMVSVAMTLGMARRQFDSDPEAAKALLEQAHAASKSSVTELRQLVRGFHPAVLADRGLDAALSAVASRCRVPTTVTVTVPQRPSAETEAVIYFAVAEALTNVDKHAGATECTVSVVQHRTDDGRCMMTARTWDNGHGGAQTGDGLSRGGLAGMRDRVRAAGGLLRITSPVGGPTEIIVEVPCAS